MTDDPANPNDGPPRCQRCDYELTPDNAGVCPECGLDFDLSDPSTIYLGGERGNFTRVVLSVPPWMTLAIAIASCACATSLLRDPSIPFLGLGFCVSAAVSLPALFLIWLKPGVIRRVTEGRDRIFEPRRAREHRWSLAATSLLLAFCIATNFGFCTAVWTWPYLGKFNRLADEAQAMPTVVNGGRMNRVGNVISRKIGPWNVDAEHYDDGVVVLYVSGSAGLPASGAGFVRVDDAAAFPEIDPDARYRISPSWYGLVAR